MIYNCGIWNMTKNESVLFLHVRTYSIRECPYRESVNFNLGVSIIERSHQYNILYISLCCNLPMEGLCVYIRKFIMERERGIIRKNIITIHVYHFD